MIKIFIDSADTQEILALADNPLVQGFTTNPSLMRQAFVREYETWARNLLALVREKPISFEVIADDFDEMERQAYKIASWGANVYVKIPITNTRGTSSERLISTLSHDGVKVNVTAILTRDQVCMANYALRLGAPSFLSIFAGRIADTGSHPAILVPFAVGESHRTEVLWASTREVLNVYEAERAGCDIITLTPALFAKYVASRGKDLEAYSLETVQQFYRDATEAGYTL